MQEFTGSVDITGSLNVEGFTEVIGIVNIPSGSGYYSGSGEGLFNIPRSALAPDALQSALIVSGAVTASVDPQTGFVVTSVDSGSTFSGSIFYHLVHHSLVVVKTYLIFLVQH